MALINCPECGHEVSDLATSCPNCGCPLTKEPELAPFKLERENKSLFCAIKYEAFIDNQSIGILKNGESITMALPYGTHHLDVVDKTNFNKNVYSNDFIIDRKGVTLTFSAAMKLEMATSECTVPEISNLPKVNQIQATSSVITKSQIPSSNGRKCPKCGGTMIVQTVSESKKAGCGTILLYVLLAVTIFGLLIVIPLLLRKKTETVTYAVCQNCGHKIKL